MGARWAAAIRGGARGARVAALLGVAMVAGAACVSSTGDGSTGAGASGAGAGTVGGGANGAGANGAGAGGGATTSADPKCLESIPSAEKEAPNYTWFCSGAFLCGVCKTPNEAGGSKCSDGFGAGHGMANGCGDANPYALHCMPGADFGTLPPSFDGCVPEGDPAMADTPGDRPQCCASSTPPAAGGGGGAKRTCAGMCALADSSMLTIHWDCQGPCSGSGDLLYAGTNEGELSTSCQWTPDGHVVASNLLLTGADPASNTSYLSFEFGGYPGSDLPSALGQGQHCGDGATKEVHVDFAATSISFGPLDCGGGKPPIGGVIDVSKCGSHGLCTDCETGGPNGSYVTALGGEFSCQIDWTPPGESAETQCTIRAGFTIGGCSGGFCTPAP
jgi:hypothetical protein